MCNIVIRVVLLVIIGMFLAGSVRSERTNSIINGSLIITNGTLRIGSNGLSVITDHATIGGVLFTNLFETEANSFAQQLMSVTTLILTNPTPSVKKILLDQALQYNWEHSTNAISTNVLPVTIRGYIADRWLHLINRYSTTNQTISSSKLLNIRNITTSAPPIMLIWEPTQGAFGKFMWSFDGTQPFNASGGSNIPLSALQIVPITNGQVQAKFYLLSNAWLQVDLTGTNLLFVANAVTNSVNLTLLP